MKGSITRWRFWPSTSNSFEAFAWRPTINNTYSIFGGNQIASSPYLDTEVTYTVPTDQRLQVDVGDNIGFYFDSPVIRYDYLNGEAMFWVFPPGADPMAGTRSYSIQAVVSGE